MAVRLAVLTISDRGAAGQRADTSGDFLVEWAGVQGFEVAARETVSDDSDRIAGWLCRWADDDVADVILTTGGTGFGPRDVTPEATRAAIERDAPGISEAIRAAGRAENPRAALSRGVAGTRGHTLIVNLPGSPSGVKDGVAVLGPLLQHVVQLLTNQPTDH